MCVRSASGVRPHRPASFRPLKSKATGPQISNLVTAYTTLLDQLLSSPPSLPSANMYCFAETGEHTWRELGEAIHAALKAKGLVDKEMKQGGSPGYLGSNSRSSADRLRAAGWKGDRTNLSVFASVPSELAEMLKGSVGIQQRKYR